MTGQLDLYFFTNRGSTTTAKVVGVCNVFVESHGFLHFPREIDPGRLSVRHEQSYASQDLRKDLHRFSLS